MSNYEWSSSEIIIIRADINVEIFVVRLQIPVRPSKPVGFSYLHPNLPPSPPLSSVTSAISSPGHSPQGMFN